MDRDTQAAIEASLAEQAAGQQRGGAGSATLASNIALDGSKDCQAEAGRASEAPANATGAVQTAAADQAHGTERTADSEHGGGNMAGAQHSNTGEGGTTRKRLLGGYAAQAAARHRQRVALQQAMRKQNAEEGVT